MNELAQFVYRLIHDNTMDHMDLSKSERAAVAELQPLLDRDPDAVAAWLDSLQTSAADWLIPPLGTLKQSCP